MKFETKKGFSLMELSLVLVFAGLLVGGILVGVSLIGASEIQRLSMSLNSYEIAAKDFKSKYYYWPGDMVDANLYWSAATAGNGNGDVTDADEEYGFWQQLSLADFLSTSFDGNPASGAGVGYPAHQLFKGAGVMANYNASYNGVYLEVESLDAKDAAKIDIKIDDSLPLSGRLHGTGDTDCYSGADYKLAKADQNNNCNLRYNLEGAM